MLALICLAVFLAGATAGILGLVVLAIRLEDKGTRLPVRAPGPVSAAGRLITGLRVREPSADRSLARPAAGPGGDAQRRLSQSP